MTIENKTTSPPIVLSALALIALAALALLVCGFWAYSKWGQAPQAADTAGASSQRSVGTAQTPIADSSAPMKAGSTISVLFIGNSLTFVNDLPKTLSDIAGSLGDKVEYDMAAPGGYSFMQHAKDQTTLSKIKSRAWDFEVLQDQSELPALPDYRVGNEVMPYALQLDGFIHAPGSVAKTVFFQTWGYKHGDPQYCAATPTLCTYMSMQDQLSRSYDLMAQKTGGILAPVGEAWRLSQQAHPEFELYQGDGKHPSPEGTYLAACVFYMILFKKDVAGAANLAIDPAHASFFQKIAKQAVSASLQYSGRRPG